MKFTKEEFEKNYSPKEEEVDELYNPDGDFGGDKPNKPYADITVDTPKSFDDTSDYDPDIPQTTDDFVQKTQNKGKWWVNVGYGGTPYSRGFKGTMVAENSDEVAKGKMLKMIKELLQNKTSDNEIVDKTSYSDVNRNNVPDIQELNNSVVISKTNEFLNTVNSNDLSGEDLGVIINHILTNVNLKDIPTDYKNLIKRNL